MPNRLLEDEYLSFLRQNGLRPYDPEHSQEQFERLDRRRKAASGAEGVETDYPQEVHDRLAEVIKNKEMTFQPVVRHMADEVEKLVEPCLGVAPPQNIFAGEFPTGSFNALACPVRNGTLILVNTGAMALISKMMRLMIINIYEHLIGDLTPQDIIEGAPERFKFKSGQSPLTVSEVIDRVARCVFGYVISESALLLPKLPILGGAQRTAWSNLTLATERFIISHEYGHAVRGHLARSRSALNAREMGGLKVYQKAWEDEFEADLTGARLMLHHARSLEPRDLREGFESFAVSGVLIFFELDKIVSDVARALYPERSTAVWVDHPPSQERAERLLEFFDQEQAIRAVASAAELTQWLDGVRKWTTLLAEAVAGSEADPDNRAQALNKLIPAFSQAAGEQ